MINNWNGIIEINKYHSLSYFIRYQKANRLILIMFDIELTM